MTKATKKAPVKKVAKPKPKATTAENELLQNSESDNDKWVDKWRDTF